MDGFMQWFWLMLWWFVFVMYLVLLFRILGDLFGDRDLSGWWKALWVLALVALPYLTALVYVIARGKGMAERQIAGAQKARAQADAYIRDVAGSSPTSEIARGKELLDQGAIDAREFAALKAKALA
ncbi:hypothetical protein [Cellulomonas sp. NPDC058312]|uniref:hypothetical protein n=1 Tax=Cellulomonas sp. NPDC058312 TaxID=3346441 RepID=UPI0036E9FE6C